MFPQFNLSHFTPFQNSQVVVSFPTHRLIKLRLKKSKVRSCQKVEMIEKQVETDDDELSDDIPKGQILWIRGLTRLQHQVKQLKKQNMLNYHSII